MTRRIYRKPPIEEAVCEFHFAPSPDQDFAAPSRFYDSIKTDYPGKQEFIATGQIVMQQNPANFQIGFQRGVGSVLFPDSNRNALVGLGTNQVSIHALRPYMGWESYRSKIESVLNVYGRTLAPVGVNRVDLRYINKIDVPTERLGFSQYFSAGVVVPPSLGLDVANLFTRAESTYPGTQARLVVMLTSVLNNTPDRATFVLDLQVNQEWPADTLMPLADTMRLVDDFRERERDAFEAFLTDDTRNLFDAE